VAFAASGVLVNPLPELLSALLPIPPFQTLPVPRTTQDESRNFQLVESKSHHSQIGSLPGVTEANRHHLLTPHPATRRF
jgi:hypothetical protein